MGKITVVGVGYAEGQLTEKAAALMRSGARVVLHTDRCPCADWLRGEGIAFSSLDDLYESLEDFDEHARGAAARFASLDKFKKSGRMSISQRPQLPYSKYIFILNTVFSFSPQM